MANTFPSTGNVGIGTTAPENLLTIDAGSSLGIARIKGRSPIWLAGATSGAQAHMGIVTVAGDYISGSAVSDSFFFQGTNAGKTYLGRSSVPSANSPVMTIDNANVRVGVGTVSPSGKFVAADANGMVQLVGGAVAAGSKTLALGYGGSLNSTGIGEAGFVHVEQQGSAYRPLMLQPLGGAVIVAPYSAVSIASSYPAPDLGVATDQAQNRFRVIQYVGAVANPPAGNAVHVMSSFEMNSKIAKLNSSGAINDTGCARFIARQDAGGAWVRALEAQVIREDPARAVPSRVEAAETNSTWGLEVGMHTQYRGTRVDEYVGIYLQVGNQSWLPGGFARAANTGLLIQGKADVAEGISETWGWDQFILCRQGQPPSAVDKFKVDHFGAVVAASSMTATSFIVSSSSTLKADVTELSEMEALGLIDRLDPVRYRLKSDGGDRSHHLGFIAEDVPTPLAVEGNAVDLPGLVATLTRVVKTQRDAIRQLERRIDQIEAGSAGEGSPGM